ncbi:MAG: hypothetical protein CMO01_31100 [Thalassobius sp.]|nr:hypothetical protein [Thalassovita sp.]
MKIKIEIGSEIIGDKRTVHINDELSHHLSEETLQSCLKESRMEGWKRDESVGRKLGIDLWQLFNGSGGLFQSLITDAYSKGEELHLYFHIPYEIDALPLELLNNNSFVALRSNSHIIRQVETRNEFKTRTPKKQPLNLIFMACSPSDLHDATLSYEEEEELILNSIDKYPIDMAVEDSGSLEGLENTIFEFGGVDIVHLSGHAGIDPKLGPVFYMEDELGKLDKVTPQRLWKVLKGNTVPEILFLSGCSTGKSDKLSIASTTQGGLKSFAHQMVALGCPIVLGWGLPVSDTGATAFTAEMYRLLAGGQHIDFAIQGARQVMEQVYHPWPLMRVFTDGSKLTALVARGQKLKKNKRQATYKHLQNTQVKVLEFGFIGRRREIQQGLKVLKGFDEDNLGILIHGPAGVGKSCLVGKLIERMHSQKELLVFHGELQKGDLLAKFRELFNRKGIEVGINILNNGDVSFEQKIAALFRDVFSGLLTIIYWDDFEQNLERVGDEHEVKAEFIELVKSVLSCFHWTEGESNVVITSRYPFKLEVSGEDLGREHLLHLPLMSFTGASLEKKKKG